MVLGPILRYQENYLMENNYTKMGFIIYSNLFVTFIKNNILFERQY